MLGNADVNKMIGLGSKNILFCYIILHLLLVKYLQCQFLLQILLFLMLDILGLSNDDKPKLFPSVISKPNKQCSYIRVYIGHEAYDKRNSLNLKNPVSTLWVNNWDDMEKLWIYTFDNILGISPKENPVLLSTVSPIYRGEIERITQIMFEKFVAPAIAIVPKSVLTLYAHGLTTACVVRAGHTYVMTVPIYEGHILSRAIMRPLPFGGEDLTYNLMKLLNKNGCKYDEKNIEILSNIKEKMCYISLDPEKEINDMSSKRMKYTLPDGQITNSGHVLFQCTEPLFDPALIEIEQCSVQEQVYNSIMRCDVNIRNELFSNIILDGGPMMTPGITQRMQKEITEVTNKYSSNIEHMPERIRVTGPTNEHMTWSGGCVLASTNYFQNQLITFQEYDEIGPNITNIKCF